MAALRRGSGASCRSVGGIGDGGGEGGGGDGGGGDGDGEEEKTRTSARFRMREEPGSTIVRYKPASPPQSKANGPYDAGTV